MDHASFFSEATLIEIGVYSFFFPVVFYIQHINIKRLNVVIKVKARLACLGSVIYIYAQIKLLKIRKMDTLGSVLVK